MAVKLVHIAWSGLVWFGLQAPLELKVPNLLHDLGAQSAPPGSIVGTRPLFLRLVVFRHFWLFLHYVSGDAII